MPRTSFIFPAFAVGRFRLFAVSVSRRGEYYCVFPPYTPYYSMSLVISNRFEHKLSQRAGWQTYGSGHNGLVGREPSDNFTKLPVLGYLLLWMPEWVDNDSRHPAEVYQGLAVDRGMESLRAHVETHRCCPRA